MDDSKLIDLFLQRSEQAIFEVKSKYNSLLMRLANNITDNIADAEECTNDTYLKLWNTIPPQCPGSLKAYAARITRNLAIDCYRRTKKDQKYCVLNEVWEELEQCIPNGHNEFEDVELKHLINGFLATLNQNERILFVTRYWQTETITNLAKRFGLKESAVKMRLLRTRELFKKYLAQEGIQI